MADIRLTEFAKSNGMNSQQVRELLSKEDQEKFIVKKNNRFVITETGQEALRGKMATNESPEKYNGGTDLIATIQETIEKKDEQINYLQKLLDQQQQLNAKDKKLIEECYRQPQIPTNDNELSNATSDTVANERIEEMQSIIDDLRAKNALLESQNQEWIDEYRKLEESQSSKRGFLFFGKKK